MRIGFRGRRGAKPRLQEGPAAPPPRLALTADLGRGVLGDHGVGGEFGVQNAAVRVGVHGQRIQQLAVLQHPRVLGAARLRHQRHHMLCGTQRGAGEGMEGPVLLGLRVCVMCACVRACIPPSCGEPNILFSVVAT
mgnify:CR=1 FL=1